MWLPLLAVFIWLAWAGWNESQKVEAYRVWAKQFAKVKYDIYAVLGQDGNSLTWGKPTRKGPMNLQTFFLQDIESMRLLVNNQLVDLSSLPNSGSAIALEFLLKDATAVQIPFTEIALATEWYQHLQHELEQSKLGE